MKVTSGRLDAIKSRRTASNADPFKAHRLRIALDTLRMNDVGANIMGGMSKNEARSVLRGAGYSDAKIAQVEA